MFAIISTAQKKALLEMIGHTKLTLQQQADVLTRVGNAGFADSDRDELLAAITAHASQKVGATRLAMQNYTSFQRYLTDAEWKILSNDAATRECKEAVVISRLLKLGCRNPSESTSKLASSFLLVHTGHGAETQPQVKLAFMQSYKSSFKKQARQAAQPKEWILTLPPDPEMMRLQHHTQMQDAFTDTDAAPVAPSQQILDEVMVMDRSFSCRAGGKHALHVAGHGSAIVQSNSSANQQMQTFEQFGKMFLQSMQAMQNMWMQQVGPTPRRQPEINILPPRAADRHHGSDILAARAHVSQFGGTGGSLDDTAARGSATSAQAAENGDMRLEQSRTEADAPLKIAFQKSEHAVQNAALPLPALMDKVPEGMTHAAVAPSMGGTGASSSLGLLELLEKREERKRKQKRKDTPGGGVPATSYVCPPVLSREHHT